MFELGQRKFLLLRPFSGLGRHVCAGLVRQGTLSAAPTAAARRVGFPASGQYSGQIKRCLNPKKRKLCDGVELGFHRRSLGGYAPGVDRIAGSRR